jgi:hypothetical protein
MTIILSEQACDELWQAQELTVQSDPLDPLDVTYRCPPSWGRDRKHSSRRCDRALV